MLNGYIQSLDENGNENIEYFKQDCELDAYAFSYALMHYKYEGKYDALLYLPDIYHNQMKDEFKRAFEEFVDSFK